MDSIWKNATALLLAAAVAGCTSESKPEAEKPPAEKVEPAKPLTAARSLEASITSTVAAINHLTRELTLKGPDGEVTFIVDRAVQRLDEVKVGDRVTVNYTATIVGELRPPTEEEKENPIVAVAAAGRTPQGEAPAAGAGWGFKVVTTVQAIDLSARSITLVGPLGGELLIANANPENLKQVKVGDSLVLTYSEGLAVSLQKAPK